MASKKPSVKSLIKKTTDLTLNENGTDIITEATHFYPTRKDPLNFSRLEKGLFLFIYVYETSKQTLTSEISLWDHRLCVYMIKDGQCPKSSEQCHHQHQTQYRQANLCTYWYINNTCTYGKNCKNSHQFEDLSKYHQYLSTENEANIYKLIRFTRNFSGHYLDSVINQKNDQQDLYKNLIILMTHLVHILSRKRSNSIEHLNLFLEATTIKQLLPERELLIELEKPYQVPEIFFDLTMNFNDYWYKENGTKRTIDFNRISGKFVRFFNKIFVEYFKGRLESRGAKAPWDE